MYLFYEKCVLQETCKKIKIFWICSLIANFYWHFWFFFRYTAPAELWHPAKVTGSVNPRHCLSQKEILRSIKSILIFFNQLKVQGEPLWELLYISLNLFNALHISFDDSSVSESFQINLWLGSSPPCILKNQNQQLMIVHFISELKSPPTKKAL